MRAKRRNRRKREVINSAYCGIYIQTQGFIGRSYVSPFLERGSLRMLSTLITRTQTTRTIIISHRALLSNTSRNHLFSPHLDQTMTFSSCLPWNKSSSNRTLSTFSDDHETRVPAPNQSVFQKTSPIAPPPAYQEKPTSVSSLNPAQSRGFSTSTSMNSDMDKKREQGPAYSLGLPVEEARTRLRGLQSLLVEHKLDY